MTLAVGVIGLGAMGRPMAERLAASGLQPVVIRDLDDPALATLAGAGARRAGSIAELAAAVDVIVLSLPDASAVHDVSLGPEGIAAGGRPGLVVLDTSTIEPDRSRAIARALAERQIDYVDAPVSGGTGGAAAGTLSVMAGGDEAALARARPVLDVISERVVHLGPVGAGQIAKACNQLIVLGTIELVAEALSLAEASGLDPAQLREALLGGFAGSTILDVHGARMLRGDYVPGGQARFHLKDIAVVSGLGSETGVPTPSFDAAARQLEQLVANGGGGLDHAALKTLLDGTAATPARRPNARSTVKIVITGGCGFLGVRLARRLLERGELTGPAGTAAPIEEIVLADAFAPDARPAGLDERARIARGDIAEPGFFASLLGEGDVSIFHLASVVSAQAETDPELAFHVNVEGARSVLQAAREHTSLVRLVTTSSYAAFGGDLPAICDDRTKLTPESTYGMTKAVLELLVNDATRRGALDGRVARLPIVIVRPGAANQAASSMASAIFREPLSGRDYEIPVGPDTPVAVTGVRTVVEGLIALHEADGAALGLDRAVCFPNAPSTVGAMVDELHGAAGDRPLGSLSWRPDPRVEAIVQTWPSVVDASRALALGVPPTDPFARIIGDAIADIAALG